MRILLTFVFALIFTFSNAQTSPKNGTGDAAIPPPPGPCSIDLQVVTGGGTYCAGDIGLPVGLVSSNSNCNYQLVRDGVDVGQLVHNAVWGAPISFGNQTVPGVYTVKAYFVNADLTNDLTCPPRTMSGSAIIYVSNNLTTPTFATIAPICNGASFQLPSISSNGIAGTWSPTINNQLTTTYFFTPSPGQCSALGTALTVVVNTTAAPTGNSAQSFPAGATVLNLAATGSSIKWYSAATGGTELGTSTPLVNGNFYYASQTIDGCESAERFSVQATVAALPPGITTVLPTQCGITLSSTNSYIYANLVPNAQAYRFRVKHMGTGETQIKDSALRNLMLSSMSFFKYNQEYQVEVAVKRNNVWENYGVPCNITTPIALTKVVAAQCGTALASPTSSVTADLVDKAMGYRFKVTNLSTNSVQTIDKVLRSFAINLVTDYAPGTTYSVEVAVRNTDGLYLPYGAACNITTAGGLSKFASVEFKREKAEVLFEAKAFPNPFNTGFSVGFTTDSEEKIDVKVFDLLGRQLESRTITIDEQLNDLGVEYPSGIYTVVISQGDSITSLKVIKR